MDNEFLRAEVAALLKQMHLSKPDAASVLDSALNEVFAGTTCKACCPHCQTIILFSEFLVAMAVRLCCTQCGEFVVVVTGIVKTKRQNMSGMVIKDWGTFVRFIDSAGRERYAALYGFLEKVELKSKDVFSLCVGERFSENHPTNFRANGSVMGIASFMNLTLKNKPVIGTLKDREEVLENMCHLAA